MEDNDTVSQAILDDGYQKLLLAEKKSPEALAELEASTRGKGSNLRWGAEHVGRITSSIAHKIYRRRSSTKPDKLVSIIMGQFGDTTKLSDNDPRAHGHCFEASAREAYIAFKSESGCDTTVTEHGLFVHADLPYLAASTDGIVHSATEGKGVLEIKCPVSTLSIVDLCEERKDFSSAKKGASFV